MKVFATFFRWLTVMLLAALTLCSATAPASAAPCAQNCLAPGDYAGAIVYQGLPRTYLIHVPASYTGQRNVPLLIDLHGGANTALIERQTSGQLQESDRRGFVAVWPDGIGGTWNGNGCCLVPNMVGLDDVGFVRAVIGAVKVRAAIDADRVFVTGISNGGALAQRIACEAADVVRAATSVSFPLNTDQCHPSRPIQIAEFAGTADTNIPYDGTNGAPAVPVVGDLIGFHAVESARASFAAWKVINRCSDDLYREQLPEDSRLEEYRSCAGGVHTALVTLVNVGHIPYPRYPDPLNMNHAPIDVAPFMWDRFFNL
uniref:alpha/beta hydrolase family esterase n=1 Tax=uncultured Sphingomonas sp. TaxID=158754 RepID=UPI0035CACEDB